MTKTKLGLFAIPVIAAIMIGSSVAPAMSDSDNAAVVITDFSCFINLGGHFGITDDMSHSVKNNNQAKLVCHFSDVTNPPDKAEKFEGWTCNTQFGSTTDTRAIFTPSGQATIICTVDL